MLRLLYNDKNIKNTAQKIVAVISDDIKSNFTKEDLQTKSIMLTPQKMDEIAVKNRTLFEDVHKGFLSQDDLAFLDEVDKLYDQIYEFYDVNPNFFIEGITGKLQKKIKRNYSEGNKGEETNGGE